MRIHPSLKMINRYTAVEIAFFITFFFLFPVLTDVEYRLYEQPYFQSERPFIVSVLYYFISGLLSLPPYLLLYKLIIQRLLLKKKYLLFLAAFIFFLIGLNFYTVYGEYWTVSKLTFLPSSITRNANDWFHNKTIMHFSIIYVAQQTLVLTALGYFIHFGKEEKRINALKQAKLESDLNYLKAQVQPHFFFNTLNNIYSLAQQQSMATAPLVAKLSEMMRYIIYETVHHKVSLQKEIDFMVNYVGVESVRYNEKIAISFDTQGVDSTAMIEPLLLLPFIENTFKHGLQNETEKGFIEIVLCMNNKDLVLQARNSKPALNSNSSHENGIGLANVKERLNLLYGNKHSLVINDSEISYEIILTLELNGNDKMPDRG